MDSALNVILLFLTPHFGMGEMFLLNQAYSRPIPNSTLVVTHSLE